MWLTPPTSAKVHPIWAPSLVIDQISVEQVNTRERCRLTTVAGEHTAYQMSVCSLCQPLSLWNYFWHREETFANRHLHVFKSVTRVLVCSGNLETVTGCNKTGAHTCTFFIHEPNRNICRDKSLPKMENLPENGNRCRTIICTFMLCKPFAMVAMAFALYVSFVNLSEVYSSQLAQPYSSLVTLFSCTATKFSKFSKFCNQNCCQHCSL